MNKQPFLCPSADGIHTLAGVVYLPEKNAKGFLHVVHGMTEYIGRYASFMEAMAEEGCIVFGYDHLGHGMTASNAKELGYIAKKNGWDLLLRDVKGFSDAVRERYGKDLPYYLMGHSMGSFVVRLAAERYVKPQKLIVMGTGGPNPAAGAGLALIALLKLFFGDRHISPLLQKVAFGSYNKRFTDLSEPDPWLTTDLSVRRAYKDDPLCKFKFTVSAMGDLIRLTKNANRSAWYRNLPKDLPIFLLSGAEDAVGGFGKGVRIVERNLLKQGIPVSCRLYEGARHEILNDFTYQDVKKDILSFLET